MKIFHENSDRNPTGKIGWNSENSNPPPFSGDVNIDRAHYNNCHNNIPREFEVRVRNSDEPWWWWRVSAWRTPRRISTGWRTPAAAWGYVAWWRRRPGAPLFLSNGVIYSRSRWGLCRRSIRRTACDARENGAALHTHDRSPRRPAANWRSGCSIRFRTPSGRLGAADWIM